MKCTLFSRPKKQASEREIGARGVKMKQKYN